MNALLRIVGWLLVLAGLVLMVTIATGALDGWLDEHWTCASSSGRNAPSHRRECGWLEAEWSALVLSAAIACGGFVMLVIAAIRSSPSDTRGPMTIDLSRLRRRD